MYTNDSYSAEKAYDNLYERSEDVRDNSSECSECNGTGKEFYSDCCGADVHYGHCTDCEKPCQTIAEDCETCLGEGEVSE